MVEPGSTGAAQEASLGSYASGPHSSSPAESSASPPSDNVQDGFSFARRSDQRPGPVAFDDDCGTHTPWQPQRRSDWDGQPLQSLQLQGSPLAASTATCTPMSYADSVFSCNDHDSQGSAPSSGGHSQGTAAAGSASPDPVWSISSLMEGPHEHPSSSPGSFGHLLGGLSPMATSGMQEHSTGGDAADTEQAAVPALQADAAHSPALGPASAAAGESVQDGPTASLLPLLLQPDVPGTPPPLLQAPGPEAAQAPLWLLVRVARLGWPRTA